MRTEGTPHAGAARPDWSATFGPDRRRRTAGTIAGVGARYRCSACGNLTRFDVTLRRRTRAFHHYSLGGELVIEHEDVLAEEVEDVACRWCGTGRGVEQLGDGTSR